MNNLYITIRNVYEKCKINTFPFDCIKILNQYGYKVYTYSELKAISQELYDMCKIYSDDAFLFEEKKIIAYNDAMPRSRIRFTLMHELGHILFSEQEDEADYFASCILAPRVMIHQLRVNSSRVTADDIHDYFDISITAANRALTDYHRWFDNIAHTTRKPTEAELTIKELFIVEKPRPIRKIKTEQRNRLFRYVLDPSNDDYFIREMERRRTEPY